MDKRIKPGDRPCHVTKGGAPTTFPESKTTVQYKVREANTQASPTKRKCSRNSYDDCRNLGCGRYQILLSILTCIDQVLVAEPSLAFQGSAIPREKSAACMQPCTPAAAYIHTYIHSFIHSFRLGLLLIPEICCSNILFAGLLDTLVAAYLLHFTSLG